MTEPINKFKRLQFLMGVAPIEFKKDLLPPTDKYIDLATCKLPIYGELLGIESRLQDLAIDLRAKLIKEITTVAELVKNTTGDLRTDCFNALISALGNKGVFLKQLTPNTEPNTENYEYINTDISDILAKSDIVQMWEVHSLLQSAGSKLELLMYTRLGLESTGNEFDYYRQSDFDQLLLTVESEFTPLIPVVANGNNPVYAPGDEPEPVETSPKN